MEARKGQRIILFPLPFKGHLNPMLNLAGVFHRRGFSVTVIHAAYNSPDISHYPHFTFRSLIEEPTHPSLSSDLFVLIRTLNAICAVPFRDALKEIVTDGGGRETVSCLVSDAVWGLTAQAAADEVGVKRVVLRTTGAASFAAFVAFPLLRDLGYIPLQESRLEETVAEIPPLKVKDLPVIKTGDPEGMYKIVNDMVNAVKSSSGVIWNTFADLEQTSLDELQQLLHVPFFSVGPLHKHKSIPPNNNNIKKDDENHVVSWLDKCEQRSVLYVSFGSLAAISETEFLKIACGLRNSGLPFLWVVRPDLVSGSEWVELLSKAFEENWKEKGKIVKWANQQEVLGHDAIGAFWTHCGWNSVLESMSEGVPMICMPCFTDQRVNARYVEDVWRIGESLDCKKVNTEEIVRVVKRVMGDDDGEGRKMRERAVKLKESAKMCLELHGSSSKSLEAFESHVLSSK